MSIDNRLNRVLRQVLPDEAIEINDALSPQTCQDWDSVTTINLMFMIEQEFAVRFVGTTFLEFGNVGEIRTYLERAAT